MLVFIKVDYFCGAYTVKLKDWSESASEFHLRIVTFPVPWFQFSERGIIA